MGILSVISPVLISLRVNLQYCYLVTIMASLYEEFSCPNCHIGNLTKIDRMVRCTCGWWTLVEESEEVAINSNEYVTIVAS